MNGVGKSELKPSQQIDQLIAGLADWRGETFAGVRKAILGADPDIIEEWKWMGSPVWSRDGIIAVGNAHKGKVKLTFMYGAKLADPDKLFNAGLDGNGWLLQEITARVPGRVEGETTFASPADLAAALRRAGAAHGEHEKRAGGQYDTNWPDWYAEYIVREQAGQDLPS